MCNNEEGAGLNGKGTYHEQRPIRTAELRRIGLRGRAVLCRNERARVHSDCTCGRVIDMNGIACLHFCCEECSGGRRQIGPSGHSSNKNNKGGGLRVHSQHVAFIVCFSQLSLPLTCVVAWHAERPLVASSEHSSREHSPGRMHPCHTDRSESQSA